MPSKVRPLIINPDKPDYSLKPLPKSHRAFTERYLQELLVSHPELLPVETLRPDVGDLLCIGREVSTQGSGNIDNLYLSTGGYVVVVETKLWRNPESRREVLSQVLDYVKVLVTRDFNWLETTWNSFCDQRKIDHQPLLSALADLASDDFDEAEFIDRVQGGIDRGDVIALIVGDGIQTRLQQLVAHLCRDSAHLRYSLGLVALRCYELGDNGDLLVMPELLQEVESIQRAHVRIDISEALKGKIDVVSVVEPDPVVDPKGKRRTLSEDSLFTQLAEYLNQKELEKLQRFIHDLYDMGIEPEFKSAALMLKVPDPTEESVGISLMAIEREGRVYNPDHAYRQVTKRWHWDKKTADDVIGGYWKRLHSIDNRFSLTGVTHVKPKAFIPLKDLISKLEDVKSAIADASSSINEARENQPLDTQ